MKDYIENQGFVITNWEVSTGFGRGYLANSLKKNRSLGMDKVEIFIRAFPEVDLNWLFRGKQLSINTYEKPTPAINTSQIMDKDFHYLKIVNLVEDQNDKLEKDVEELKQANAKLKKENEQLSKKVLELEKENHSLQERLNG
jgi:hypothetical protein